MKKLLQRAVAVLMVLAAGTTAAHAQFQSDGYKFLKAVRDQDVLAAKSYFDKPGSTVINARDYSSGESALHIVVKRRDVPWINFLAQAGANLEARDNQGLTPLIVAAQLGFTDGVRVLLARGADVDGTDSRGQTPLMFAVQARDVPTVRALIEGGADPDQKDRFSGSSARDYATRDPRGGVMLEIMHNAHPKKKAAGPGFVGPR